MNSSKGLRPPLIKIFNLLYNRFGPMHWWPGSTRLEVIVGAILTQNTAWGNVEKAIANLKKAKALNVKKLTSMPKRKLAKLIRPAGYYNIKSQRLKNFLHFLNDNYKGNISRMFKKETDELRSELLAVKGIGPETADSILLYAGQKPVFVVDAYTKRIFSRHKFIDKEDSYEDIQRFFSKNLPRDEGLFNEFHALIVNLGKNICKTKKPLCNNCPMKGVENG